MLFLILSMLLHYGRYGKVEMKCVLTKDHGHVCM
jgi:hypothetical protein